YSRKSSCSDRRRHLHHMNEGARSHRTDRTRREWHPCMRRCCFWQRLLGESGGGAGRYRCWKAYRECLVQSRCQTHAAPQAMDNSCIFPSEDTCSSRNESRRRPRRVDSLPPPHVPPIRKRHEMSSSLASENKDL
ncbi:unnamed protein product, partial [Mycena citricolor]